MAVTFAISTASTTGGTTDASGSFTPAAGDLLVVFVVASGTVGAGTCTESLGETTFTKVTSALKASSADTLYAFVSNQPLTTSGARTVTFGTGGGSSTGTVITVYRVSGQSLFGLAAIRQSAIQSNQAAAGTPAPAFTAAVLTGNPTLGVVGNATNAATMTPPASWTEDSDNGYATPPTGQESVSRVSGFTGTTVTWGGTSASAFGDIVLEIDTSTLTYDDEDTSSFGGSFLNRVIAKGVSALALSAVIFSSGLAARIADQPQDEETVTLAAYPSSYPQTFTRRISGPGYAVRYAGEDNDVAPQSAFQPDEDFWRIPPPTQASLFQHFPLGDQDEIPAGSLFGQPDEDFWRNAVAPFPAGHLWPQQWAFDVQEPAGALFGQPDEDFWRNAVAPFPAVLYQRLPLGDPEEIPASSLFGQDDEDFWNNAVPPVQATIYQRLPLGDPEEIPAASLFGQADEDFWANPVAPVKATFIPLYLFDAQDIVPAPASPQPDEDCWQNPVLPVQASLFRSSLFSDLEEIPAGALFGQFDEDFWRNAVAPVSAYLLWPQQWSFDVQDPAGSLFGQYDEDFWRNPVAPVPGSLYQRLPLGDPEQIPAGSLFGQADEDFWINPVRPIAAAQYRSPVLGDSEELPAGALLSGQPDEDFWRNAVAPTAATLFQRFPYLFDSADFISPVQPLEDEDFWINGVPPGQSSLYRSPLFVDQEELPAGSLLKSASVEEYYWQNPVAPVAASLYRSPIFRDPEEVPAGALLKSQAVEEYYWQNQVPPSQACLYQRLPYGFDAGEIAYAPTVAPDSTGGGSLPARRGRKRPGGDVPQVPQASVSAVAHPVGLSVSVRAGAANASASAIAEVGSVSPAPVKLGIAKAKGIRNPTDEELIAILLAT